MPEIHLDLEALAGRLSEALRFQTISYQEEDRTDRTAFTGLHALFEARFPKVNVVMKREEVNELSLLYTWEGSDAGRKPILLMGHLDVVPVEAESLGEWRHPPFEGRVVEGFVWGRGALDDKSSVMGLLEAAEWLLDEGFRPRRTIYFAFGHDEEIGGDRGAVAIAELLRSRAVELEYVLDEGMAIVQGVVPGTDKPAALIGIAEKGYLTLELTARTEGGHSSQPPEQTTIGVLAEAIGRLERKPFRASLGGPVGMTFDALAPEMPFLLRAAVRNRWLFGPLLKFVLARSPAAAATIRTTTAVTMISGGLRENVLPSEARAIVNLRILPGETIRSVTARVEKTIRDERIEIKALPGANNPTRVSPVQTEGYRLIERTARQVFADAVTAPALVLGGTDARHYSALTPNVYRFMPVRFGPDDLTRVHGTNERISTEAYGEAVKFYIQLIRNSAQ